MRQQYAYPTNAGIQLKLCATPAPLFKGKMSVVHCMLKTTRLKGSRVLPPPSSKHNVGLMWSWLLTSWPPRSTFHAFTSGKELCKFAVKSVYSFSKYSVHKLVTDGRTNKRTDGQTKGQVENIMRPASPDWRMDKYCMCSLSVLPSCVFITLSAFCPR